MIRIACLSIKGGVGSSTISQQILAPYLLSRTGTSILVEAGTNVGSHAGWMSESRINRLVSSANAYQECSAEYVSWLWMEIFEAQAGKSFVLDALEIDRRMLIRRAGRMMLLNRYDLILVPLVESGSDIDKALETYRLIKECEPEASRKVVFCLNRFPEEAAGITSIEALKELMGDQPYFQMRCLEECFSLIEGIGIDFLVVPELLLLKKARLTGLTLHEIADQGVVFRAQDMQDQDTCVLNSCSNELRMLLDKVYANIDALIEKRRV